MENAMNIKEENLQDKYSYLVIILICSKFDTYKCTSLMQYNTYAIQYTCWLKSLRNLDKI